MSLLARLFRRKVKNASLTVVGPSKAGKTTLIRYLETGEPVSEENIRTTLGVDIREDSFKMDGWNIRAIDTGGQEIYRQTFWELAIQQADAVIFVVDATLRPDHHNYDVSRAQFDYALDILPGDIPLLVLLNKQDLKALDPMGAEEALEIFNMDSLRKRTVAYLPCSAKYGDGVEYALKWLLGHIDI